MLAVSLQAEHVRPYSAEHIDEYADTRQLFRRVLGGVIQFLPAFGCGLSSAGQGRSWGLLEGSERQGRILLTARQVLLMLRSRPLQVGARFGLMWLTNDQEVDR
ncbi:hypothetical protein [Streptomyces lavendulae]|uniref:hypothetical protein n=1 Tax=Streptomyces lavendulae TaxID=1914 RepID=UPI0036EA4716